MSDFSLSKPRAIKSSGALGPIRDALISLSGWQVMFVASVLGAIGNLAYAPFHVVAALAISLGGLIWLIDGARRRPRWARAVFARTIAFGFGHFLAGIHWIAFAFTHVDGAMGFVWLAVIVLPLILAAVWAVFMVLAATFWSSSPSRIFVFAFFFGLAEYVRGTLFGGFPWNLAGTTWVPGGPVSQVASIGGIYWLTLMTAFAMASPAALSDDRERSGLAIRVIPLLLSAIAIALGWSWGAQRLQTQPTFTERHVVLIDAGIPMSEKFEINADVQLRRYLEIMQDIPGQTDDIVIWPESPIRPVLLASADGQGRPAGVIEWPDALDAIAAYLGERTLILGSQHYVGGWDAPTFNALAVIDGPTAQLGPKITYNKFRLVPLGELAAIHFVPFGEAIASFLPDSLQNMASDGFTPGAGPELISYEKIPSFVPLVCYEALFPYITRANAAEADWLVNISLDGWFGGGIGPQQHFAQARYRAIESGRPLARAASRGVTAMIDPYGNVTAYGSVQPGDPEGWRSSAVRTPLPKALEITPYIRFGSAFFWITLVIAALLAFSTWRR